MADLYGPEPIPLVASAAPTGRDPLTYYVLSYLQAIANAHALAEWRSIAPNIARPSSPVNAAIDYNPRDYTFSETQLPMLVLYRDRVDEHVQIATSVRVERGVLNLQWLPPDAQPEVRRIRSNFANKLFQLFDVFLERARDPAWKVVGDTYYDAQTYGSTLPHWAKYRRLRIGGLKQVPFRVSAIDGSSYRDFEAYSSECPYELELSIDPSRYPPMGIDATVQTDGDEPVVIQTLTFD